MSVDEIQDRAPSVGEMFRRQVAASQDREAFRYRGPDGNWTSLSWRELKEIVYDLAAGLLSLGLQAEERVAIASTTRMEWILADFAIMCAGGATTTVYPNTKNDDVVYILSDSESRFVFAENIEQAEKLLGQRDKLPQLARIILMDGTHDDDLVMTWADLRTEGQEYRDAHPEAVDAAIDNTGPESLSTLIYTSGTTGRPKGVRLAHDAWAYEGAAVRQMGIIDNTDMHFLWLPLSHVFGKCLLAVMLETGFTTAVDGDLTRIVQGLGEIRPTVMAGAPRIFEKVRNTVMIGNASGVKSVIARWAFSVGQRTIPYRVEGRTVPRMLSIQYAIADKLVFSKLKAKMGGRVKFFVSGSAKLNAQVQNWFWAAGITLIEGYGMTETSAITFLNDYRKPALGTVGPPIPGTECRIADDGEILVRGPGVTSGYENLPEATAEAFSDGWFHTGDIGELDAQGNLRITDRKKDLLKTSGGKYVAPQKVEGALMANCPYISQVVCAGEGHKYMTALIALDPDAIATWAEANDLGTLSYPELVKHDKVRSMVQNYVESGNQRLERWETVKDFRILEEELSQDFDEITPSLKIRRGKVTEHYKELIESMYEHEND